jgi:hypothetical protein
VIRPGGHGYVTVIDRHALEKMNSPPSATMQRDAIKQLHDFATRTRAFAQDFAYFSVDYAGPAWDGYSVPQVCYDIEYLASTWGRFVDVVAVREEAYDLQTALVFQKPDPTRTAVKLRPVSPKKAAPATKRAAPARKKAAQSGKGAQAAKRRPPRP